MLEPGSSGTWIGGAVLAALLVAGTAWWVRVVIRVGRRVRGRLERRFGVAIERQIGIWQISDASWRAYPGNRAWLLAAVNATWVAFRIGPIFLWLLLLAGTWFGAASVIGR